MTTMQRYYMQASRSEIQPRIKRLVPYLLGEAGMTDGAQDAIGDREVEGLLHGDRWRQPLPAMSEPWASMPGYSRGPSRERRAARLVTSVSSTPAAWA